MDAMNDPGAYRGHGRSQLFTVRLWPEELGDGHVEWRGKIQYAADGETLYFRNWEVMVSFLRDTLEIPPGVQIGLERPQAGTAQAES